MSDIRDAGPRLRQMNGVLEQNERLIGRLAWTERERDSLRRSIKNLAAYVAELNAEIESLRASVCPEPYEKSDEKRVLYDTKSPRNGALSGCETAPDPDSRVWETPCAAPQPHATPGEGSVRGEGSVPRSRTENEPVAWATFYPNGSTASVYVGRQPPHAEPLYRHPPRQDFSQKNLTLTDAEREAIKTVIGGFGMWVAQNGLSEDESLRLAVVTLRGLLDRSTTSTRECHE